MVRGAELLPGLVRCRSDIGLVQCRLVLLILFVVGGFVQVVVVRDDARHASDGNQQRARHSRIRGQVKSPSARQLAVIATISAAARQRNPNFQGQNIRSRWYWPPTWLQNVNTT